MLEPVIDGTSWWDVQGVWVEPVNERRQGISGVQRVVDSQGAVYYVKRQTNHLYRSLRYPRGRPTLLREWLNLQFCAARGIPTAPPQFFDMRKSVRGWEAVLVTRGLDGFISLEDGIRGGRWTCTERRKILLALAELLVPLHRAGRKHGHLYPKEILVRTEPELSVALLDWEVARYVGLARWAAQSDLARLWRSLIALDVGDADRRAFLERYCALAGLHDLQLRGVPALTDEPSCSRPSAT